MCATNALPNRYRAASMGKLASLLRFVSVNAVVACVTVGIALGVSNVLVNHVHWLGAYLIACPVRSWNENTPLMRRPWPLTGPTITHLTE
jgi:hypothetical protein